MSANNNTNFVLNFNYGKTISTEEMEENMIYLDGACRGPKVDNDRRSFSFDHHADCVRAFTLATCQQVALALELGFDHRGLSVVVNDVDADTVVSVWLLLHPERVANSRVQELVETIGFVDCHGPAVPGRSPHPMHFALSVGWGVEQTEELLWEFISKLDEWFETGKEPTTRAPRPAPAFGLNSDWELLDLGEVDGFQDVYGAGCVVGVVEVPGRGGTIGYTIGKVSDFVTYSVTEFLARANELEEGWGGASTIGGAPRKEGGLRSSLTREQVEQLLLAGV